MNYREIKTKRDNLHREINALLNARHEDKSNIALNEKIENKKREYKFYCGLLKNYELLKGNSHE